MRQEEHLSRQRRSLDKTRTKGAITRRGCGVDQAQKSLIGVVHVVDEGHHQVVLEVAVHAQLLSSVVVLLVDNGRALA